MTKKEILSQLETTDAIRSNRIRVSELILQNQQNFLPLLEIVLDVNNKTSIKAAWILEFVFIKKPDWLFSHLDLFTKNIKNVHFGSAVRPVSKICQLLIKQNDKTPILALTNIHKEQIIETAFDWMISDHKVAIKAYAMNTLYNLGKQFDWIHEELTQIITNNMDKESAAYKSRGKITLLAINKFSGK